jgi:site-specific DNA recombinase
MQKIIGYARTSTENQKEGGTIEIQRQALQEYASQNNYELIQIFEDEAISGGREERPALMDLFNFLENSEDVYGVVIYKLDRLARDLIIQEGLVRDFQKLGVKLLSTKESDLDSKDPTRVMFRQLLGMYAEYEKWIINTRLSSGRLNKIRSRKAYAGGGIALGYEVQNDDNDRPDLAVCTATASTIQLIYKMRKRQRKAMWEIAKELNEANVPTARGGKWYASTISYILKNKLYKGVMEYAGQKAERTDLKLA